MFHITSFVRSHIRPILGIWLVWITFGTSSCADNEPNVCTLQVPVYDPTGNRLEFRVTRVVVRERPDVDLLAVAPSMVSSAGDHISFADRKLLGRVFVVSLENAAGKKITQPILWTQCPQRSSVRFGVADAGGDVNGQTITGRLTGCSFAGDWWMRATPMFGAFSPKASLDGYIAEDGRFSISGDMSGERYLLIIGRDKEPVKTASVNVTMSIPTDAGTIDLSSTCPHR